MKKIKMLWIAQSVPCSKTTHAGGKTFYYYFNQFLSDQRFEVNFIGIADGLDRVLSKETIESELSKVNHYIIYWDSFDIRRIINLESSLNLWNRNAGLISNYYEKMILNSVRKMKDDGFVPDIIILEWTSMVILCGKIKNIFPNAKFVASEHDVTFVGYERKYLYYRMFRQFIWKIRYNNEKKKEIDALKLCDLVLPHNADNIELLMQEGIPSYKLQSLVPYYNDMSSIQRNSNNRDILFWGSMSRPENYLSVIWFLDNVMPRLEDLNIKFVVLGNNPPKCIRDRAGEKVIITGYVESIIPCFENAMCMVAPLVLGAGIKVKILEGLSSGMPVITNNIGIEGIGAEKNKEFIYCDNADDYEAAIRRVYFDDVEFVGINGRKFVKKTFDMEESAKRYKEKIIELIKR